MTVKNVSQGVLLTIVARACDRNEANDAAVFFVGKALDVLSLQLDLPLHLSLFEPRFKRMSGHVKRRVHKDEWLEAFRLGREYEERRPHFSRSIGWYRKGLVSEDPIDRLLGFWSALEGIGTNYFRETDRTRRGVINQICDCFDQIWGSSDQWKVIPEKAAVVNDFCNLRNGIAHGFISVDVETIREIIGKLPLYQELVHTFLVDWESQGGQIENQHESKTSSESLEVPITSDI